MRATPKELMKQYVDSQKFTSTSDIMAAMKEMFRDALQQVMESELDMELGYEKSERVSENDNTDLSRNYRNGYSKMLYLASKRVVERRTQRCQNWDVVLSHLNVMFEGRTA